MRSSFWDPLVDWRASRLELEDEGVEKFNKPFGKLRETLPQDIPELMEHFLTTRQLGPLGPETQDLHQTQRRHVLAVLREVPGNKVHAARALGINRRALYRLLDKYHLRDLGEQEQNS